MSSMEDLERLFINLGFQESKIKEILKNAKVSQSLEALIKDAPENFTWDKSSRALIHTAASILKGTVLPKQKLLVDGICKRKLKTVLQVDAALKYLKKAGENAIVDEMDNESGVGKEVTEEEIEKCVLKYLNDHREVITTKRYKMITEIFAEIKNKPEMKWADPRFFKPIIDREVLALLGPKDERDLVKEKKKKEVIEVTKATRENTFDSKSKRTMFNEGFLGCLYKVGENPQADPALMEMHMKKTKGRVHTRFPPEPNGFLHIGHSKAIVVNFGFARYHNGVCYLRFDDTNPQVEAPEYFSSIKRMVAWLGFKPWKVTYSSDYFPQLYDLAEVLIKNGKGYVCHCTAEEIKSCRGIKVDGTPGGPRVACKHRERPIEENLSEFRKMKNGHYQPGEAILRMKQDLTSQSPQMWDLIAYRVLNTPHPRVGSEWKIYPTYDFTHCLVDSLENITHSLCTNEFYLSRESYEWLCDQVHVFRPGQREYGRLNITGTVLSKRKIARLVNEKYVRGWDDPRLFSLEAIRRRGVPPGAILSFINTLSVTNSDTNIQIVRFESAVRKYLEDTTPRLMFVLDPIEVVVDNLPDDYEELVSVPYRPGTPEFGSRTVPFTKKFYIEKSDFSEVEDEEFFRLTISQPVGLIKVPYTIAFKSLEKDAKGNLTRIHVIYENNFDGKPKKPKTYIQWVPFSTRYNSPVRVSQTRIYNQLFKSENPNGDPSDINPESETIYENSMIEHNFNNVITKSPWVIDSLKKSEFYVEEETGTKEICRFQAMRVGYFTLDKDSTDDRIVLNRIVSLKNLSN